MTKKDIFLRLKIDMNLEYTGECPNKTTQNYIKFMKTFSGVIFRMSGDLRGDFYLDKNHRTLSDKGLHRTGARYSATSST